MGVDRRREGRRKFKINKNYIVQFVCVVITCVTIIVSTIVINNLKKQIPIESEDNISAFEITNENKKQVNDLFSFALSNLEISEKLSDSSAQYTLTCKYYSSIKNMSFKTIDEQYIHEISEDIYRNLGYVYFDDYKETYYCISKSDYINTYMEIFSENNFNDNDYSKYYITSMDAYIVPKICDNNENIKYVVKDIQYNNNLDIYVATLYEVDVLKIYSQIEYEIVKDYLNSLDISQEYLTGTMVKVNLKRVNDIFVFDSYCI